jgi:CHAT domain-containing protein
MLVIVSLHFNALAQQGFVDSIRNMLTDLDSSIHFAPINNLLKHAIPFCYSETVNDSLRKNLKTIISEDYILLAGLKQAVSPHLLTKYFPLLLRISRFILDTEGGSENADNELRLVSVLVRAAPENGNFHFYTLARQHLTELQRREAISPALCSHFLAQTYTEAYKPDSFYILNRQSLLQNPNFTREENILFAKTAFLLANYCYFHNKRDTAIHLYQQQINLRKKIYGENTSEYAYWLIATADMYSYLAKFEEAQSMNFKALEITRNTLGEKSSQYALCLGDIGEVYYRTGEYDKALPYTRESLELKREIFGNGYFDNVVSLHNLATLYNRMGLYNEAIPLLQESLAISKKYFGERMVYSVELNPLAEVYEHLGEYDKALPLYQKSIQIQRQLQQEDGGDGRNVFYSRVLHSIASLYMKLGQFDRSLELFKQALIIEESFYGEANPEYIATLNAYAEAWLLKGDHSRARQLQVKSLSLSKKVFGGTHPTVATGLYNLASLYYEQNDFRRSEEACNQALLMKVKIFGGMHPDVASCLDLLGNISRQQNKNKLALEFYKRSFLIREKIMSLTHPDYIKSLYNLGTLHSEKGLIQTAAGLLMTADSAALLHIEQSYISLSEEEKLIYLRNTERQFQYLPSLLYLKKISGTQFVNRAYTNALGLKSMVLFQQQQVYNNIRKSTDSTAIHEYNTWRFNKAFLGQQLLLPKNKRLPGFDSLSDATTQMEEQLSRISSSFRNNTFGFGTGISDVSQNLSENEAAIEFIRFRVYDRKWTDTIMYAALILLPGKDNALFIPVCEEKQLKKLLRFSNNTGEAAVSYFYPAAGQETYASKYLYSLVWRPLEPYLNNIKTIYYSPSGLLFRISFSAIHTTKGKMLADQYDLKMMLCTRNIASHTDSKPDFRSASLWGDINYSLKIHEKKISGTRWTPLPGTKTEINNIYSLLTGKNISSAQMSETAANEERFKAMHGNSPSLLHIATHGFFLPQTSDNKVSSDLSYDHNTFSMQQNPMFRNGLLLAGSNETWSGNNIEANTEDGVLTAYEISHLDLSNTQLVTLSACETALGDVDDNEGVFGLQRAFKMAGVKQVLMSLWSVPDKETSELMVNFYSFLLQNGDAHNALHSAQMLMKKKYSPYYWAAFVLTE